MNYHLQFFAPLTEPVGMLWFLMILGVLWLLCRRQWRSALWLGLPAFVLFVLGSTHLVEKLVAREERPWAAGSKVSALQPLSVSASAPYDAVVALGGGDRISPDDPLGFALSDGASRFLTAIQLVRSGRARTLVLGGSWPMPGRPDEPSMNVLQAWVTNWELVQGTVTNLGICINTHDEAVAFRKLALSQGWSKVILVTSALHMRRGAALFAKQGIEVTPVAADFQVLREPQAWVFSPFPTQHRLSLLALYLHEKIGWWVYRWRGWI
ncbi:MAG: YdcF family protein [Verrucomicrobiota bacterium]|jgi:uncharacterized SAM-binding protein YcdF (DUF218 family)